MNEPQGELVIISGRSLLIACDGLKEDKASSSGRHNTSQIAHQVDQTKRTETNCIVSLPSSNVLHVFPSE